eukprot:5317427-Pyramimonas_sp.AAC.1
MACADVVCADVACADVACADRALAGARPRGGGRLRPVRDRRHHGEHPPPVGNPSRSPSLHQASSVSHQAWRLGDASRGTRGLA